jgi:hypothetical protein
MHRRGIVLVVGFLVAVVVAGGTGVSAPRLPGSETTPAVEVTTAVARAAVSPGGRAVSRVWIRQE